MQRPRQKIRIGITMGDPSGVGPEIIAKAVKELSSFAQFVIIGDHWVFQQVNPRINNYKFIDLGNIQTKKFSFGKIKAEYGRASIEYLDLALELIRRHELDCLVTAPISKEAINLAGIKTSGHTEYLQEKVNVGFTVMMLLNQYLRFSLATRHLALKDIPKALNSERLYKTILMTHQSLKHLFLIKQPRIGVCGLNPHASDHGLFGNEEVGIIQPVIKRLKDSIKNIKISGPYPSDALIRDAENAKYDCVIAMYHDQALIPLKLTEGYGGVNITLGLPFVRTSPLHGTAFDIAGKNLARPDSLIEAIKLALNCTLHQQTIDHRL